MPDQKYAIEFIAGGVVKDAEGNVVDDSSERICLAKTAFAQATMEGHNARAAIEEATARVIEASLDVAEAVARAEEADIKTAEASVNLTQVEAEIAAAQKEREG